MGSPQTVRLSGAGSLPATAHPGVIWRVPLCPHPRALSWVGALGRGLELGQYLLPGRGPCDGGLTCAVP